MSQKEDWLMRPVINRMCLYENLKNGVLDLEDVATMNEALDVKEENERRAQEAAKK